MEDSCAMLTNVNERPKTRATLQEKESALIRSALAVLLERQGGEMTYTQSEYAAIVATRGRYLIEGEVDKSGPGEPVIRVKLIPDTSSKGPGPVS
jgi:hypothetical protein